MKIWPSSSDVKSTSEAMVNLPTCTRGWTACLTLEVGGSIPPSASILKTCTTSTSKIFSALKPTNFSMNIESVMRRKTSATQEDRLHSGV